MTDETLTRFHSIHIADALIQEIAIENGQARCRFELSRAAILDSPGADRYAPKVRFSPATLEFTGVRAISFSEQYQLNATIVDFGAVVHSDGEHLEFWFELTGGTDPDAFMASIKIWALHQVWWKRGVA